MPRERKDESGRVWVTKDNGKSWYPKKTERGSVQPQMRKGAPIELVEQAKQNEVLRKNAEYQAMGAEGQARQDIADDMSIGQKAAVNYIDTPIQMAKGLENIAYFGQSLFDEEGAMENTNELRKEMDDHNKHVNPVVQDVSPAMLASMPWYLASGRYAQAPANKLAEGIVDATTTYPKAAAKGLWARGSAAVSKYGKDADLTSLRLSQLPKRVANEMDTTFIQPLNKKLADFSKRYKMDDHYFKNAYRDVISDSLLSAAESGVHYSEDAVEGGLGGMLGSAAGKTFGAAFERSPVRTPKYHQELIAWAEGKGMRVLPGFRTGIKKYQDFEADLRRDDKFSGAMQDYDIANEKAMNRTIAEGMGMDMRALDPEGKGIHVIDPDTLNAHRDMMRAEYEDLAANTIGQLNKKHMDDTYAKLSLLPKAQRANAHEMLSQLEKLGIAGARDANGRFTGMNLNGRLYQEMRTVLKDRFDTAEKLGNTASTSFYRSFMDMLDESIERGVKSTHGEIGVLRWKDLNERWAMTDLVVKNGMDITNKIDHAKLARYFTGKNEVKRTVFDEGADRLKEIRNASTVMKLHHNTSGSSLMRLSAEDDGILDQAAKKQHFMNTPLAMQLPVGTRAKLGLYQKGYPAESGLAYLNRHGPYSASKVFRAANQSIGHDNNALGMATGAFRKTHSAITDLNEIISLGIADMQLPNVDTD